MYQKKDLRLILTILLGLTMIFSLGCFGEDDDDPTGPTVNDLPEELQGSWHSFSSVIDGVTYGFDYTAIMNDDGTGTTIGYDDNGAVEVYQFVWSAADNSVSIFEEDGTTLQWTASYTVVDDVVTFTQTSGDDIGRINTMVKYTGGNDADLVGA